MRATVSVRLEGGLTIETTGASIPEAFEALLALAGKRAIVQVTGSARRRSCGPEPRCSDCGRIGDHQPRCPEVSR